MTINEKNTKCCVVNGNRCDKERLITVDEEICYTSQYLYLGAWFTETGKMNKAIELHETYSEKIVNKFSIFGAVNSQMPYMYKKVFEAAITSSLLYSSESWLTNNIKRIEKQYNKLLKCLLGVRKNTSINFCMLEAGIPPVKALI